MHGTKFYLYLLFFVFLTQVQADEQLGELKIAALPDEGNIFIVRNPNEAVLIVRTTLPRMSFENNMGVIRVDNPDPGEYRLHLPPGTNLVTFKAEGYVPVRERFYIEAKTCKVAQVIPKRASISEKRPEITLQYSPQSPDERIAGSIDGNILHIDFDKGGVILRPSAGRHVVKLNSEGRIWTKTFDLKEGETVVETVEFPEEKTETVITDEPGGIFLESDPPGAMVYMNETLIGQTPLTLEDVQPGRYNIDVARPLYVPENLVLDVKPLVYTTHSVKLTPNFGILHIESDPPGAMVYMDGAEKGATPLNLHQIDAGAHGVRLARSLFYDVEDEIKIEPGDTLELEYKLTPKFGSLIVDSDPQGAKALLDGKLRGTTPATIDTIPKGDHLITLQLEHYHELAAKVNIEDGRTTEKTYPLKGNFALLTVSTEPEGATVAFIGEDIQPVKTPFENMMLKPDSYYIKIEKENYEPYETEVMLPLGASETIEASLERYTGTLKISSKPQLAEVFLDGEFVGKTPTVLQEYPTGAYRLRVEKKGFDIVNETVNVERKRIANVHRELSAEGYQEWMKKRRLAIGASILTPGAGQVVSKQNLRGSIYFASFAASLIFALDAKTSHEKLVDDYQAAQDVYNDSKIENDILRHFESMQNIRRDMISKKEDVNMYLLIAGGIYALQLADAWFFGGGPQPGSEGMRLLSDNVRIKSHCKIGAERTSAGISLTFGGGK